MSRVKWINWALLATLLLLGSETLLNLLGRQALIEGEFGKAQSFLSWIGNKELLGLVYYKQEKFEEAYDYYSKRKDWRGMGWAYYGMGKYEEAEDYFKRVKDSSGLGQVKLANGLYTEAKQMFSDSEDYSGIALTYLADEDFENAKKYFLKAGDDFGLGLTYFAKGDYKSAKTVFSNSHNKTVRGIQFLMDQDLSQAEKVFQSLKYTNLLASTYRIFGDFEKALDLYLQNNNRKQAARLLLDSDQFASSLEWLKKEEDFMGLGDLYWKIGDFERAFEMFDKGHAYTKAFSALAASGNLQRAKKYGEKILAAFPDLGEIAILIIETHRLAGEYREAELRIQDLKKKPEWIAKAKILECRLDISRQKTGTLTPLLQESVQQSGQGFLSDEILQAANLRGFPLAPPSEETVSVAGPGSSFKVIQYALFFAFFLLIGGGGFLLWRQRPSKSPEMEDLTLGHGEVSRTHKQIYQDSTSLNLSTVSKLQGRTGTDIGEGKTSKSHTPAGASARGGASEEKLGKSGVQILQMALKRLNVTASALELLELAGENSERLTVYGIYLASRAKGVQVQGIKVDLSYLQEGSAKTHLVFFTDESFALMNKIAADKIELVFGLHDTMEWPLAEFKGKWNGYVITLSKSS